MVCAGGQQLPTEELEGEGIFNLPHEAVLSLAMNGAGWGQAGHTSFLSPTSQLKKWGLGTLPPGLYPHISLENIRLHTNVCACSNSDPYGMYAHSCVNTSGGLHPN